MATYIELISMDSTINKLMMRNMVRRQSRRWRPLLDFATNASLRVLFGANYTIGCVGYKAMPLSD